MTPTELKALAERVYPDKKWLAGSSRPFYEAPGTYDFDEVYFDPSLTGEDWQKAQALDCIVAAFAVPGFYALYNQSRGACAEYFKNSEQKFVYGQDILEAACRALLDQP